MPGAARHTSRTLLRPIAPGSGISAFVDSLPDILAAADFKTIVRTIVEAKRQRGGILWGFGGHVIKTGAWPDAHSIDGTRFCVGHRHQWRRHDPRLRDRVDRRDLRRRRRGTRSWTVRHGRRDRTRLERSDYARGRRRSRHRAVRRSLSQDDAAAVCGGERAGVGRAPRIFRSRCTSRSAPTSFTCTRPHPAPHSAKEASEISATSSRTSRDSSAAST